MTKLFESVFFICFLDNLILLNMLFSYNLQYLLVNMEGFCTSIICFSLSIEEETRKNMYFRSQLDRKPVSVVFWKEQMADNVVV